MSLAINITIGILVAVIIGLVVVGTHSLKQHEETIHQQEDTISKQEETINNQTNCSPSYSVQKCSPLNYPDKLVQGNCQKGELCSIMGCTSMCQTNDECKKFNKYLPDDTLQWVCQNYGGSSDDSKKMCMIVPNPRVTLENRKNYINTAQKNCGKMFYNAGQPSIGTDDYCYMSRENIKN
tara:strand:+ start:2880 stop:3419 length:540 start_codon:yes stop_codon:yes gene_type:complete